MTWPTLYSQTTLTRLDELSSRCNNAVLSGLILVLLLTGILVDKALPRPLEMDATGRVLLCEALHCM